jgi:hypothetical protein
VADAVSPTGLPRWPLLAAALVALPSFFVPFLSDDWANLRTRAGDLAGRTPFGNFLPVSQATFVVDRALWGAWPLPWHLTNLVFVVASTALLMALVQRHLRDRAVAGLAGILFALHPYHIDNVAWISGRSDAIAATFLFAAMLAYDRWRERGRGVPIAADLLFLAALASRESTWVLPALLVTIGWARDRRPPPGAEVLRGLLPLFAIAFLHFLWLRPLVLGPSGRAVPGWAAPDTLRLLIRGAAAAVVPLHPEHFGDGPSVLGGFGAGGAVAIAVAALILGTLGISARRRAGHVPPAAWIAGGLFVLLAFPSFDGLRGASLFLPVAASALLLAALLRAAGKRTAIGAGALLAIVWCGTAADHWIGWRAAARASASLVADLADASRNPAVQRIVVANLPRRVRGMPVGMEFTDAIATLGGRPVPVVALVYLDYRRALDDDLAGAPEAAVTRTPDGALIELLVPERLYSRNVMPGPADPDHEVRARDGTIRFLEPNHLRLMMPAAGPGTAAFVWQAGRLVPLETAPADPRP